MSDREFLSPRRAELLGIVVREYVETAAPVGSETVVHKYALALSPATVRNEMVRLEEEGYLTHPHTSAGRVPSDKGYRFYVESLMEERDLPAGEQRMILHQFHQVARQIDEWTQLAAATIARLVGNAAMVTMPRTPKSGLRQIQMVGIQEDVALLVVVSAAGRVKQEMINLPRPYEQDELQAVSGRLNTLLSGKTAPEVGETAVPQAGQLEEEVIVEVVRLLEHEDASGGEAVLDGIREVLRQPEFSRGGRLIDGLDLLDERFLMRVIPFDLVDEGRVAVVIGRENPEEVMQEWSVIFSRYGPRSGLSGAVAVLGPTRMEYDRSISTVRFVSSLMHDLLAGYYREGLD